MFALLVSLVSLISITVNDTHDYTFVSYIVSMWVWLGGAYVVVKLIKQVHGNVSVVLVANYLIVVCTAQCLIAYWIDVDASAKAFVDSFLGGEGFMGKNENRLYGIGAALDVAGLRFSAVLVMISYICSHMERERMGWKLVWYLVSFLIIVVIGNMMSRTTTIGAAIAIIYGIYESGVLGMYLKNNYKKIALYVFFGLAISMPIIIHLYHTNQTFYTNFRFAFEGFFSLVEKGRWETHSTDVLQSMVVYPETFHTWFIGDGYFDNPSLGTREPYYIGKAWKGFYKDTDIGYLRYIFYFGIVGLATFIMFFINACKVAIRHLPAYRTLLIMFLILNLIGWFKVATDIFLVFAIFLCISREDEEEYNKLYNAVKLH